MDSAKIYKQVQDHYGDVARADNPEYSGAIAQAFGYSAEELASIPRDANLGLSCGNPLAIASLREGETVIDLGSGAGFDIFLASKKVGPDGLAIGVDMNKDMLARANANKASTTNTGQVSFVEGRVTSVPLHAGIADCIISNCVINLVPEQEKPAVFAEMARLLKPGGRVAISDILARKQLPAELRESVAAYVGCLTGASSKEEYARWLEENGFGDIVIADTESDLNVYIDMARDGIEKDTSASCCMHQAEQTVPAKSAINPCCSKERKASGCCSTPTSAKGCCLRFVKDSTSSTTDGECCTMTSMRAQNVPPCAINLTEIDINEFAGSFKIFAVKK